MSLLGRPWQLGEVRDVEALARSVLERKRRKLGACFRADFEDECLSYLFETAWKAWQSYDPKRGAWEPRLRWKLAAGVTVVAREDRVPERPVFSGLWRRALSYGDRSRLQRGRRSLVLAARPAA